jgi:hypothetical protein
VPTVLISGSLNLLEPLGPVQACNGIALPLPLATINTNMHAYSFLISNGSSHLLLDNIYQENVHKTILIFKGNSKHANTFEPMQ